MDATAQSSGAAKDAAKEAREQSTIQFPYSDLNDAISVARAIMNRGGVPLEPDQLAGALGQTPNGGGFRLKIATARIFGLIETIAGKYQLTNLGFAVADPQREKAARVDAFLKVPLYKKVYDEFRNKQLPPRPGALEHAFVGFGVAQKQKDKARVAFDKSAQQAGFFEAGGRDRLVKPPTIGTASEAPEQTLQEKASTPFMDESQPFSRKGGNGSGGSRHPFIEGLLERLPEPDTVWSIEGRAAWLEAAASVFKLIYQGDGKITVTAEPKH